MSELFWSTATSDLALYSVGGLLLASLALAHLPFLRNLPQIEPYAIAAGLLAYLLLADLALCIGFRIADERAETAQLKTELQWRQIQLETQKATAEDAQRLAEQTAAEANELKEKVSDYEAKLASQPPGACALDAADIDSLRALSRRPRKR